MSDSDEDLTENHLVFQNENTFLRGQASFLSNRFKNAASSTYNSMCNQNFMNGHGTNRQRSIYQRRETSPMSLHSVPDFPQHNFDNSRFIRGTTCDRSVINGRSQSPGSVGSMDSTTSAAYVAQIFKNMKFNKYDKRIINEAYNKYFRNRARRRIGKRRKLKLFLKHNRRKSDDSGDEGSNSSISSDDNRSVRSAILKESILKPSNRSNRTEILHFRATMKESDMYKDCTENLKQSTLKNMFNEHQHTTQLNHDKVNIPVERQQNYNSMTTIHPRLNGIANTQKERFTKGFMMPSQRFNKSVINPIANNYLSHNIEVQSLPNTAPVHNSDSENEDIFPNQTIRENTTICRKRTLDNSETTFSDEKRNKLSSYNINDDITFKKPLMPIRKQVKSKTNFLSDQTISKYSHPLMNSMRPTSFLSQSLNHERLNLSHNNKSNSFLNTQYNSKPLSTGMAIDKIRKDVNNKDTRDNNNLKSAVSQEKTNEIEKSLNDKIVPTSIKSKTSKTGTVKKNNPKNNSKKTAKEETDKNVASNEIVPETEKLISKSAQPLVGNVEIIKPVCSNIKQPSQVITENSAEINASEMPLSISEVSMKPSFIKRKLFTQNLDVVEEKNSSIDTSSTNSPQTRNYRFREKNKVRKLASSQSCLNREVNGEDNILDLIHKIVPADQINLTSASNQRTRRSNLENEDKWDVASVISMCNNTVESETFTDEDIFQVTNAKNKNEKKNISKKKVSKQKCQVNEKIPIKDVEELQSKPNHSEINCTTKRTVASRVRSFWDTDFETDIEENVRSPLKTRARNLAPINDKEKVQYATNAIPKDITISNTCVSQVSELKPLNNYKTKETRANTETNNINVQKNSNKSSTKKLNNNSTSKNDIKPVNKDIKKVASEPKLQKNIPKRNIRVQNSVKPVENNQENNALAKSNTKEEKDKCNIKKQNNLKNDAKLRNNKNENMANPINKCEIESQEQENKKDREEKLIHKLKEVRVYLNDSLNSSTSEHSILTRSLTRKSKQQLLNVIKSNEKLSTPKSKSLKKSIPQITPLTNKVKSIKKQIKKTRTISKPTKTTPPRRAKDKNNEYSKFNESIMNTRNRSLNTSLRVKTQKQNLKPNK